MNTNSKEYRESLKASFRKPVNETSQIEIYLDLTIETYLHNDKPCLRIWKGNASKPFVHYYFTKVENRQREIDQRKEMADQRNTDKILRKAAQQAFTNPYQIGDILYNSWGYDQTNVDFYQVIEIGKKSVIIREIAGSVKETAFMSGNATAQKDQFIGEPIRKILQISYYNGKTSVYIPIRHGCLSAWDGRAVGCSWYA